MGKPLLDVFRNSFVMIILLLASIAALALIIERLWYFARNRFDADRGLVELRRLLGSNGSQGALDWARTKRHPLGRMFTLALENLALSGDELADVLYSLVLQERVRAERLLGGLGTLANAATLLGLLGTVVGLIQAFGNIAATGSGGPAVVSGGIAEALLTTAFGLMIGIPTLFFFNYFSKKAADNTLKLESASDRLVVMLDRFKRRAQQSAAPHPPKAKPALAAEPQAEPPAEESGWNF